MVDRPSEPGTGMPPQLIRYWSRGGEGGSLIRWDTPGDYERCIVEIQSAIAKGGGKPMGDYMIHGLCNTLHRLNTGGAPGHGAAEEAMHKSK